MSLARFVRTIAGLVLLAVAVPAAAQEVQGPRDEASEAGWDGEVSVSATYAKRSRELLSDIDRSGFEARAVAGYTLPAGKGTRLRAEAHAETDKYATSYGGEVELRQDLAKNVEISLSASGAKDMVTLESQETDQAALRGAIVFQNKTDRAEVYARYRWRQYDDAAGGKGKGWQIGTRLRHRFDAWHWVSLNLSHDRIADDGGNQGYRRNSVSLDYSVPVVKKERIRLLAGLDYREWTYSGRHVGNVNTAPLRSDRLIRPETGLAWGKTEGLYARATVGYDFFRSNDARFSGNGLRARALVGYRF